MQEEKKLLYGVWVYRRDGNHILAKETFNYDEAYTVYSELKLSWIKCIQSKEPFELLSPIVTSFDPGLVFEITVKPLQEITDSKFDNPYNKKMLQNGFSNTFRSSASTEVLDDGYK